MQSRFHLHIITCSCTCHRLPKVLDSYQRLIDDQYIESVKVFFRERRKGSFIEEFDAHLWQAHLHPIYPILVRNMTVSRSNKSYELNKFLSQGSIRLFPARELKYAEMSLIIKHYDSLCAVSATTLVIEDDALLIPSKEDILLKCVQYVADTEHFCDLASVPFIPKWGSKRNANGLNYLYHNIGLTRTTSSFLIHPRLAAEIACNYWPCALPADLHHQRLFCIAKQAGIWPVDDVIVNASQSGLFDSSIQ